MIGFISGRAIAFVVLLVLPLSAVAQEYRAFWVDAWGAGFRSQAEVEELLGRVGDPDIKGRIREANCNTVFVQVRREAEVCYPSAMGEPYMSGLTPGNFNALQAMIDAAHDTTGGKQRIGVHAWVDVFKTGRGLVYSQHSDPNNPANYWLTLLENGTENADGSFDPGHPRCLEYLVNVCMDLVTNFNIDGIHFDNIRFAESTEGYNPASVSRYNGRFYISGHPPSGIEQFKQWRRDQVTAFVRQVYARRQAVKPYVALSGSFLASNPSPVKSTRAAFMCTPPHYDVYSDWDAWTEEGILDMAVPLIDYDWLLLPGDYLRWLDFSRDRKANRHMILGAGIYRNTLENAILQLQMTRAPSAAGNTAHGFCGYSYRLPYYITWGSPTVYGTWDNFAPSLVAEVTPASVSILPMSWKTNPSTGHLMGTVTFLQDGEAVDHAVVSIDGPVSRTTNVDGTGFYAFLDLPPGEYTVTASRFWLTPVSSTVTVALGEVNGNMYVRDFLLGTTVRTPYHSNVQATEITDNSARITWHTDLASTSRVDYGTTPQYGMTTPVDPTLVIYHSVELTGLASNTLYYYRVWSTVSHGGSGSGPHTFTTSGPPAISNVQALEVTNDTARIAWIAGAPSDSLVRYGLVLPYENQTPVDPTLLTLHWVTLRGLSPGTTYHYQAVSTNPYGDAESADATFTTAQVWSELIDNLDPGWSNTSVAGAWTAGSLAQVLRIGPDYLYTPGMTSTDEETATHRCRWTPVIPEWGTYDVYVFYQIGWNRSPAAPYKVIYAGGELLSIQNQYSSISSQGGWFLIGEDLPFEAGTSGYVQLTNNTGSTAFVSADAARFVRKGGDVIPPTQPIVVDEGSYTDSLDTLSAEWTASDNETGLRNFEYRIVDQADTVTFDWTDAQMSLQATVTGLMLGVGKTYFFEVRAFDHAGNASLVGRSDGIVVFTFDVDGNGMVDALDFKALLDCGLQAGVAYPAGLPVNCARFDVDGDGDVDQEDFGVFQRCITGTSPINLDCVR